MGLHASSDDDLESRLTEAFGGPSERADTELRLRSTVMPERTEPDARSASASGVLSRLGAGAGLDIGAPIGEGGMGIVHRGVQRSLGREVAIKSLKPELRTEAATLLLLREAWVTGALEHPNIVPVYDISHDAAGSPRIVLKKIGGASWASLMHDAELLRERFGASDPLEWNLRILMQVCNAIHFAHSRRLLHRDLKPENVMIGEFGEVYVLDWGLAVALEDDGTGRLPLASEVRATAGTPVYMAPEMLAGSGLALSERTDVYLLGATLYEIVTGDPPHVASSLREICAKVVRSEPSIPETVSAELAGILRRALHRDPDQRYASADALRAAIDELLAHRDSQRVAAEAALRLSELEEERQKPSADPAETRARLYHLFGECRFGFLAALRAWPDNVTARDGWRRAIELMVELELDECDPKAAALLLSELDAPPRELGARVEEARAALAAEEDRRAALARDHDPAAGRRVRLAISAGLGVVWTLLPWFAWYLESRAPGIDQRLPMISSSAMLVVATAVAFFARGALSRSVLNRSLVRAVGVVLAGQLVLFALTYRLGITYEQTRPLVLFLYAVASALVAASIERRLWPSAAAASASCAFAFAWPALAWPAESLANLVLTINVLAIWARLDEDLPLRQRGGVADFLQRRRDRETLSGEMARVTLHSRGGDPPAQIRERE